MIAQVPGVRVYIAGYGEMLKPDFIFFKTNSGLLLGVIQEDITGISKPVLTSKVASLLACYGQPKIKQASAGSLASTCWIKDENSVLALYKYSDGHTLFLMGNPKLSPELAEIL